MGSLSLVISKCRRTQLCTLEPKPLQAPPVVDNCRSGKSKGSLVSLSHTQQTLPLRLLHRPWSSQAKATGLRGTRLRLWRPQPKAGGAARQPWMLCSGMLPQTDVLRTLTPSPSLSASDSTGVQGPGPRGCWEGLSLPLCCASVGSGERSMPAPTPPRHFLFPCFRVTY